MNELKVLDGQTLPSIKDYKKITCLTKEEEILVNPQTGYPTQNRRYRCQFGTLKNDTGFGTKTGDLVESLVIVTNEKERYQTGKQYKVEIRQD